MMVNSSAEIWLCRQTKKFGSGRPLPGYAAALVSTTIVLGALKNETLTTPSDCATPVPTKYSPKYCPPGKTTLPCRAQHIG